MDRKRSEESSSTNKLDELLNQIRERSPAEEDLVLQIRDHFRRTRWSINEVVWMRTCSVRRPWVAS